MNNPVPDRVRLAVGDRAGGVRLLSPLYFEVTARICIPSGCLKLAKGQAGWSRGIIMNCGKAIQSLIRWLFPNLYTKPETAD